MSINDSFPGRKNLINFYEFSETFRRIVLFGKCTRWPSLFFCPGFYRPREAIWGSNRGKTPFSPFLQERGGKSQNRKRRMGMGGGQKIRIERSGDRFESQRRNGFGLIISNGEYIFQSYEVKRRVSPQKRKTFTLINCTPNHQLEYERK